MRNGYKDDTGKFRPGIITLNVKFAGRTFATREDL